MAQKDTDETSDNDEAKPSRNKTKNEKTSKTKKGSGLGKILLSIIVVILLVVAGLYLYDSSKQAPTLPQLAPTRNGTPQQMSGVLSSSNPLQGVEHLESYELNSSDVRVNYTGKITFNPSGLLSLASFVSPLNISVVHNQSAKRLLVTARAVPIAGTLQTNYFSFANGTSYVCTNYNSAAISTGNPTAMLSNRNLSCTSGSYLGPFNLSKIYNFDLSSLQNVGLNVTYKGNYQSAVNGMPCTVVYGSLSYANQSGSQNGHGSFETCVSNVYYLSLLTAFNFTSTKGNGGVVITESNITSS